MHHKKAAHAAIFAALRARLAFTHDQAAQYLGVPVPTYKKWESGEREPSASVLRLLDVLGTVEALAPALHAGFLPENRVMSKNPESDKPARRSPRNRVMSKNPETLEVAQQ